MTGDASFGKANDPVLNTSDLVPGTLRGYRSFKIKSRDGYRFISSAHLRENGVLHSVSNSSYWDTEKLIAECSTLAQAHATVSSQRMIDRRVPDEFVENCINMINQHETVPMTTCSCGIYGWYSPWESMTKHYGEVIAAIENKGKIVMGSLGFRAAESKIVAVCPSPVKQIHNHQYNVPPGVAVTPTVLQDIISRQYHGVEVFDGILSMVQKYPPDYHTPSNLGISVREVWNYDRLNRRYLWGSISVSHTVSRTIITGLLDIYKLTMRLEGEMNDKIKILRFVDQKINEFLVVDGVEAVLSLVMDVREKVS